MRIHANVRKSLFALILLIASAGLCHSARAADIGTTVNSEFAACDYRCTVQIPAGVQQQTTTINIPCANSVQNGYGQAMLVGTGPGSVLHFTGAGDAILVDCPGTPQENAIVENLSITLGSSATNGIHLVGFNGALIENVTIFGAPGAAILNEGANDVTISNSNLYNSSNGLVNVAIQDYSPNAIHVTGGEIEGNTNCGIVEEGSSFPRQVGNVYQGITFQYNGTNGRSSSGHMCIEFASAVTVRDNYFEYKCTQSVPYSVWVGDASYQAVEVLFSGNVFASCGSTGTISLANSFGVSLLHNTEQADLGTFLYQGTPTWDTTSLANYALGATNFVTGNTTVNYVSTHN